MEVKCKENKSFFVEWLEKENICVYKLYKGG